jgi:UDP-N-acetylmuramate--alanine ligase
MEKNKIHNVYFMGIGGIGMSALALYFISKQIKIYGYDRTPSDITSNLISKGATIHFDDDVKILHKDFLNIPKSNSLIIYTPAIPKSSSLMNFFFENNYEIKKRSQVLGLVTKGTNTLAIAGTHGKTTTSTLLAHLLKESGIGCNAFLGGISTNYNTNFIIDENSNNTVVEADEYDRSFLQLNPDIAIITSTDADHLDIYGKHEELLESFSLFASQVKPDGKLIIKKGLDIKPENSSSFYTYSILEKANFYAENIKIENENYFFDLITPQKKISHIQLGLPGMHNVENAVAASAAAILSGISDDLLRSALSSFKGVKRRFEYIIRNKNIVFIDDYAHHPEELNACISSVKQLYPQKKITGIFQPHLFSRTRDFINQFADSLDKLDQVILLEIYPARELPIEGVNSKILLDKITNPNKKLCSKEEVLKEVSKSNPELLLTLGAGDIDQLVKSLKEILI